VEEVVVIAEAAVAAAVITEENVINGFLMEGKVKWYDAVKGFGFIHTEEGKDIFVHRSGVKDAQFGLEQDQAVQFEVKESDRGPVAFNVEVI
jgi:cold shock protein